jgi:hypothetical protein
MPALYYGLGPYRETIDNGAAVYEPPRNCVGAVTLGLLEGQGGASGQKIGFFACDAPLDSNVVALNTSPGDCRELSVDESMRAAWRSATDVAVQGERLVDLLWYHLTTGSDPQGLDAAKPLLPTVRRRLELHLPGHGRALRSEPFRFGRHPHTDRVRPLLQAAYGRLHNAPGPPIYGQSHARKVLDYWGEKYGLIGDDVLQLVPPDLRRDHPGRLPHATVYTDDFNRPDEALAAGDDWIARVGGDGGAVVDEQARYVNDSPLFRRRDMWVPALSSDDHYGQLVAAALTGSTGAATVMARVSADRNNFYAGRIARSGIGGAEHAFNIWLAQNYEGGFGGSLTAIASLSGQTLTPTPFLLRFVADGSTLSLWRDGVEILTATDTTLSGHTQTGMAGGSFDNDFDDWETADLALPPSRRTSVFGEVGYGPIGSRIIRSG